MKLSNSAPEALFPYGWEVMGGWEDPTALPVPRRKIWIRFFAVDRLGRPAGRDTVAQGMGRHRAFSRIFDSISFLIFECSRGLRAAALELHGCHIDRSAGYRFWVHEDEDLTREDRARIAEILEARKELSA